MNEAEVQSLVGKYLRLREELQRAVEPSHCRRVLEEMEGLESRLRPACVPFADTLPLDCAPGPVRGGR
jgi:hypothetical protein